MLKKVNRNVLNKAVLKWQYIARKLFFGAYSRMVFPSERSSATHCNNEEFQLTAQQTSVVHRVYSDIKQR